MNQALTFQKWYDEDCPQLIAKYDELERSLPMTTSNKQVRTLPVNEERFQKSQDTLEAILSTSDPCSRGTWVEVLSHDDGAIDLSRAEGGLPLLFNHDPDEPIGTIENVRIYNARLKGRLKFGNSQRAQDVKKDLQDGHKLSMSIGYRVDEFDQHKDYQDENGAHIYVAKRWTLLEGSIAPVPADPGAKIGRSMTRAMELGVVKNTPFEIKQACSWRYIRHQYDAREKELKERIDYLQESINEFDCVNQDELERAIEGLNKELNSLKPLTMKAIRSGKLGIDLDELSKINEGENFMNIGPIVKAKPSERAHDIACELSSNSGYYDNIAKKYSLQRAIAAHLDPSIARDAGLELEISQDIKQRNRSNKEGICIPGELFYRSVTKGGSGGNLIADDYMAGEFITTLREILITGRLGARILTGLEGNVVIPKQLSDAAVGWIAGDGSDEISASDPTFAQITMSPTTVGAQSTFSRKMLLRSNPTTEQLLKQSLTGSIARAIDTVAINGDGAGNKPTGLLNLSINSATYTNGGSPSFGDVMDLEGTIAADDADFGNLAYACPASLASTLKQTEIVATTGQMIWSVGNDRGQGHMNGYAAYTSNLIPAGYLLFGNWSDLLIGFWSGVDILVDPYTRANYGDVIITAMQDCDVAIRHTESFAEIHEAAP